MYKLYFYSKPNFLYIDSESIIDLDLKISEDKKCFEMIYNDEFFYKNFKSSKTRNWSLVIQSFDENGNFILQTDLNGEKLKLKKLKKDFYLSLEFDQITNNKVWPSIPPIFEYSEINFKNEKISYNRHLKLNELMK
jgi:hypothetical protein